jgi:hypothetical protein
MNEHFTIDFADAVVIKERVGNARIGNVVSGSVPGVSVRMDTDGMLVLDFILEKGDKGDKGDKGNKGDKGDTPTKGVDYWTSSDKTAIVNEVFSSLPLWTGGSY